jgi:hypothetical protein
MRDNLLRTKRSIFLPTGAIFTNKKSFGVHYWRVVLFFGGENKWRNILITRGRLWLKFVTWFLWNTTDHTEQYKTRTLAFPGALETGLTTKKRKGVQLSASSFLFMACTFSILCAPPSSSAVHSLQYTRYCNGRCLQRKPSFLDWQTF